MSFEKCLNFSMSVSQYTRVVTEELESEEQAIDREAIEERTLPLSECAALSGGTTEISLPTITMAKPLSSSHVFDG